MTEEKKPTVGFYHDPDPEMVKEYATWPLERRAAWLFAGLKMRQLLPKEVRELQDQFRRGER
jgi:hypothetical protein